MRVPIKLLVSLGVALAGSVSAVWVSHKLNKKDTKNEETNESELHDETQTMNLSESLSGVLRLAQSQQNETVEAVRNIFQSMSYEPNDYVDFYSSETIEIQCEDDKELSELIDSISEYVTLVYKLSNSFETYSKHFFDARDKGQQNIKNRSEILQYRDIVILGDFLIDICTTKFVESLNESQITQLNERIDVMLSQYSFGV